MGFCLFGFLLFLSLTGYIKDTKFHGVVCCLVFFLPFRTSQKSSWPGANTDVALRSKLSHHKYVFHNNYRSVTVIHSSLFSKDSYFFLKAQGIHNEYLNYCSTFTKLF